MLLLVRKIIQNYFEFIAQRFLLLLIQNCRIQSFHGSPDLKLGSHYSISFHSNSKDESKNDRKIIFIFTEEKENHSLLLLKHWVGVGSL